MSIKNNILEKDKEDKKENSQELSMVSYETTIDVISTFIILVIIALAIILFFIIAITCVNMQNTKIYSGIKIKNVDVSNMTKQEAINKVNKYINENIPEEIKFTHLDYNTTISTSELQVKFDVEEAVNIAYSIGREKNVIKNDIDILKAKIIGINIEPSLMMDEQQLIDELKNISTKLPDKTIYSSYYIDGNDLIITRGKTGNIVDTDKMLEIVENEINKLSVKENSIELITKTEEPKAINIENIYNQIHKQPKDAYYSKEPYIVYPSENGLDFNITLEQAKKLLQEEKDEYKIPLKILYPKVTTNMIGTEAFPDLISEFFTRYAASNKNRTNNLILAANKINGTVVMPGEIFSYNFVVGERTIKAGYKEAPIYLNGQVVDGLGGGICQITTTLYNAVVYANLEIVERKNHQFIPSYVGASRDATVVYGVTDFKFKNNREYPIKIVCSVSNGIANFKIFGLKTKNEYEVEIKTRITNSTANSINSEAYKILKQDGQIISSELLSKDVYKKH